MLDVGDPSDRDQRIEGPLQCAKRGEGTQEEKPEPEKDEDLFNEVVDWKYALKGVAMRKIITVKSTRLCILMEQCLV